uniref:ATP9 n=1 Tax=Phakopsora pachyrhizi TaxID=170000 RepID=A0A0S1MJN9_PHAPC
MPYISYSVLPLSYSITSLYYCYILHIILFYSLLHPYLTIFSYILLFSTLLYSIYPLFYYVLYSLIYYLLSLYHTGVYPYIIYSILFIL